MCEPKTCSVYGSTNSLRRVYLWLFWFNKLKRYLQSEETTWWPLDCNLWKHNAESKKNCIQSADWSRPANILPGEEKIRSKLSSCQLLLLSLPGMRRRAAKALKAAALKQTAAHSQLTVSWAFSFTAAKRTVLLTLTTNHVHFTLCWSFSNADVWH